MIITRRQLRRIIQETQWGGFTGGAAPLDEPPLDSGKMNPEQQQKVFDILVDTGSDPKKLLDSGEFPDVIAEISLNERGTGNPSLRSEERAIMDSVVAFADTYMLTMSMNPSDPESTKRIRRTIDDIIDGIMGDY